jgi:hypothetical protein
VNFLRRTTFDTKSVFRSLPITTVIFVLAFAVSIPLHAQSAAAQKAVRPKAVVPLVIGWFNGQKVFYIQTEASDQGVAKAMGVNFVPQIANAINAPGGAVDDIYVFTNFKQGNVIPSAPTPVGPNNTDPHYTPLWQVSTVTWNSGTSPLTLTSESQIKEALALGLVTINKTNIVVNCPVLGFPGGGHLRGVTFLLNGK